MKTNGRPVMIYTKFIFPLLLLLFSLGAALNLGNPPVNFMLLFSVFCNVPTHNPRVLI